MAPPGGRTCSSAWSRADRADVLMRDRWNKVIYKCSNDGGSVDGLTEVKANPESLQLHTGTKRRRDKEDRTVNRTFDKNTTALQGQTIKVTYPLKKKGCKNSNEKTSTVWTKVIFKSGWVMLYLVQMCKRVHRGTVQQKTVFHSRPSWFPCCRAAPLSENNNNHFSSTV